MEFITFLLGLILGLVFFAAPIAWTNRKKVSEPEEETDDVRPLSQRLHQFAGEIEDFFSDTAHPKELLDHPVFQKAVAELVDPLVKLDQVIVYAKGDHNFLKCVALAALKDRKDGGEALPQIMEAMRHFYAWQMYFCMVYLQGHQSDQMLSKIVMAAQEWWHRQPVMAEELEKLVQSQKKLGSELSIPDSFAELDDEKQTALKRVFEQMKDPLAKQFLEEIDAILQQNIDRTFLQEIGHFIENSSDTHLLEPQKEVLEELAQTIANQSHSIWLVGEPGVGKSFIIRELQKHQATKGKTFYLVSARDIMADQSYIGEVEGRINRMCDEASRAKGVVWVIPDFQDLIFAGRYRDNPSGLLDYLYPFLERAQIQIIGELNPTAMEMVLRFKPRTRQLFQRIKVQNIGAEGLQSDLPKMLSKSYGEKLSCSDSFIREALQLSSHYLADQALPGSVWRLIQTTCQRLKVKERKEVELKPADLISSLAGMTGLPKSFFDDQQSMDIEHLIAFFRSRVKGQDGAVNTLVDRIAMVKSGLTDPSRPLGVFLFVGPTGTGKTEIAKTLCTFMFGSEQRLVRLDMSEFQSPHSFERLIGVGPDAESLTTKIRKQPFSVILLDEFEKAHPSIWDFFLQVFDDGRLTDATGNCADFRYSIIIMTSNLGATHDDGPAIGFSEESLRISQHAIQKALRVTFRKEFINRIDHIVHFQPLSRRILRDILSKELEQTFARRGFQGRSWAIEIDPTAYEFLLEKGYTPDLGARPLKRAIDRYLLAPLARIMVTRQFPEGDQFLYVSAQNGDLSATFIDPEPAEPQPKMGETDLGLKEIAWAPNGKLEQIHVLEEKLGKLMQIVDGEAWELRKEGYVNAMSHSDFWDSSKRFITLGQYEMMDRISFSLKGLVRLFSRINQGGKNTKDISSRMASQLFRLELALDDLNNERSGDAFLRIQGNMDGEDLIWHNKLTAMYHAWARKNGMQWRKVATSQKDVTFSIIGFGAYQTLSKEQGHHLWEAPLGEHTKSQKSQTILVLQQPILPFKEQSDLLNWLAVEFASTKFDALNWVRRYQELPQPRVKGHPNNKRTQKLKKVLGGDFDLM